VVAPVGFVSDHMEVIYDLDIEAQKVAKEIGLKMVRAATAGTHPAGHSGRPIIRHRAEMRDRKPAPRVSPDITGLRLRNRLTKPF